MPMKPPRFIRPGAPRNDKERRTAHDRTRPGASARGYDAKWHKFQSGFLRTHPICAFTGCRNKATEVHHIARVRHRPDLRLDPSNVVALCKHHHSQVTALEDGFARRGNSNAYA